MATGHAGKGKVGLARAALGILLSVALGPAWMRARMGDGPATNGGASKTRTFFRRSASTLGLWIAVVGVFVSGKAWACSGLVGALALVATREWFRMLRARGVPCHPGFGALLTLVYSGGVYGFLRWDSGQGMPADLPSWWDPAALFLAVAGPFTLQLRRPLRGMETLTGLAGHAFGFVYIAFLFHFAARLLFAVPGTGEIPGAWMLLWVVAVTKFTDMGAYLTGTLVGRHKMIPHISPAKTWEGFAGSLAFALLAGCGMAALWPERFAVLGCMGAVAGLSVVLALLAVVGDLAESVVKRCLEAKDSGAMLPGIGGALDLIDSLCFTAPALWIYLQWRIA